MSSRRPLLPGTSTSNPDGVLLQGLAELVSLARQTSDEIKQSCGPSEGRRSSHDRTQEGISGDSNIHPQSSSSESGSLLGVAREEVAELTQMVDELRDDPEIARLNATNANLLQRIDYQIQKNKYDMVTTAQHVQQTLRDEQRSRHAEVIRIVEGIGKRNSP